MEVTIYLNSRGCEVFGQDADTVALVIGMTQHLDTVPIGNEPVRYLRFHPARIEVHTVALTQRKIAVRYVGGDFGVSARPIEAEGVR